MARRGRKSAGIDQVLDALPDLTATGGRWAPLDENKITMIGESAIEILTTIGVLSKFLVSKYFNVSFMKFF